MIGSGVNERDLAGYDASSSEEDAMTNILLLQGANLTFLGRHEPDKRSIHCVLSDAAEGVIGMHSYILGPDAMLEVLRRVTSIDKPISQ
jgi:hypothetical protein